MTPGEGIPGFHHFLLPGPTGRRLQPCQTDDANDAFQTSNQSEPGTPTTEPTVLPNAFLDWSTKQRGSCQRPDHFCGILRN